MGLPLWLSMRIATTDSRSSHMTRQYLIEIWCSGKGCRFGDCYHGDCYHGDHCKVAGGGVVFFGPALHCAHQHASCHSSRVSAHVLQSMAYYTQGSHRAYGLK